MATEHKIRISAVDSASAVFARIGKSTRTSIAGMNDLNGSSKVLSKNLGGVVSQLAGVTAGFVGLSLAISTVRKAIDTVAEFQKSDSLLTGILGSPEEGAKGFEFLKKVANEYGIVLNSLAHNYARFSASARFIGLTTNETQETFTKLSRAVRGLNLDGEQTRGVFQAVDQMLSKSVLSSEELRQQLAERIPNALGIAAKSLGISMDELDKRLRAGNIKTSEFILPFIAELDASYGKLADTTKTQLSASLARATNSIQLFYKQLLNKGALESITNILNSFSVALERLGPSTALLVEKMAKLVEIFAKLASENPMATQIAIVIASVLALNKALAITRGLYASITSIGKAGAVASGASTLAKGARGAILTEGALNAYSFFGRRKTVPYSASFAKGGQASSGAIATLARSLIPVVVPAVMSALIVGGVVGAGIGIASIREAQAEEQSANRSGIASSVVTRKLNTLRVEGAFEGTNDQIIANLEKAKESVSKILSHLPPEDISKQIASFDTLIVKYKDKIIEELEKEAISKKKEREATEKRVKALKQISDIANASSLAMARDNIILNQLGISRGLLNDTMRDVYDKLKKEFGETNGFNIRQAMQELFQNIQAKVLQDTVSQYIGTTGLKRSENGLNKILGGDLAGLAKDLLTQGYSPDELVGQFSRINKERKDDELKTSRDDYIKAYRENINKLKTETSFRNRFNGQFSEIFNVGEKYRDAIRDGLLTNAEGAKYFKNELDAGRVREIANIDSFGRVDANDAFFKARQESSLRGIKPVGGTEQDAIKAILESFKDEKVAKVDEKADRKKMIDALVSVDKSLRDLKVK